MEKEAYGEIAWEAIQQNFVHLKGMIRLLYIFFYKLHCIVI